jgi:hypothetical protein
MRLCSFSDFEKPFLLPGMQGPSAPADFAPFLEESMLFRHRRVLPEGLKAASKLALD